MSTYAPSATHLGTNPGGRHLVGITLVVEADSVWNGWAATVGELASAICDRIDGDGFSVTEDARAAVTA
ncbi:hypothetical protein [Amycolatopsis echigonensis]|uniref:Uncharacterized protein n=1 Tax=Amycolatopsis echigonensis TaxID=2576905 RepID=A0A8E1W397_9PSEU|nr:hypothetical protein [Amycolatopsis echigonensis]MBB2502925.1 hypothetical protein [Amycolatopsis echigonensis]